MDPSLPYQIALTLVPKLGPVYGRRLLNHLEAADIFRSTPSELATIENLGSSRAQSIAQFDDWKTVEDELKFIERNHIVTHFIGKDGYPSRLLHCPDAPLLLYTRGNAELNAKKMLAIVGTRRNTDYGRKATQKLIEELRDSGVTIVSGMAYGIDTLAHHEALSMKLPTIGVLAHGLDRIYPASNRSLAKQILQEGGSLITENRKGIQSDKFLFPRRNRIVAGMTDATVVMETDRKGGSLITAGLAADYGRDVFALPGRTTDRASRGCIELIKSQRALVVTHAQDILLWMGWATPDDNAEGKITKKLPNLSALSDDEVFLFQLIAAEEESSFDSLLVKCGWTVTRISGALLNIELAGLIVSLRGNRYQIA